MKQIVPARRASRGISPRQATSQCDHSGRRYACARDNARHRVQHTCCREALSRGHTAEIHRAYRRQPFRHFHPPPRNAKRPEAARPIGHLMFFERGLGIRATRMPPTSTQFPRISAQAAPPAPFGASPARRSALMVNRGTTTSAGSMPRVFAGIHRMMLLLGRTGLGRRGFFRLLLCVSFG